MAKRIHNIAASVRQRLSNIARKANEDFQYVLTRYGLERLLYRLAQSPHADRFVLKGAMLFQLWSNQSHRPTRDVDLLGYGEPSTQRLEQVFREVCAADVEDDGLVFLPDILTAIQIKEDDEYQGIRVRVEARLGNARIPIQVDIGFGDAVTPAPIDVDFPALLDFPAPSLRAYPPETVVAEKFQAMVMLGIANSRMKDFYDLWFLATNFEFEGPMICQAIQATFSHRRTDLPVNTPIALTHEFATDRSKAAQWNAFLGRGKLIDGRISLTEVIDVLRPFLIEPTRAAIGGEAFAMKWLPAGPWTAT